jgi:hypothetical protein
MTAAPALAWSVVPAVVEAVVVAGLAGCDKRSVQIGADHYIGVIALDAEHDLDAVLREHPARAGPHAPASTTVAPSCRSHIG